MNHKKSEKQESRDDKLRKYGMLPFSDMKAAFLNKDNGMSIERKQLTVAISLFFVMLWIMVIETFCLFPNTIFPFLTLLLPFAIIGIFFFDAVVLKEEIGDVSKYGIVTLLVLYVGFLMYFTGGIQGTGQIWMLFVLTFTALAIHGRPRVVMILIEVVVYGILGIFWYYYPEYISQIPEDKAHIMNLCSICEIACFIVAIIAVQSKIVLDENKKNYELREELAINNEELIASNEEVMHVNEELLELTERLNEALASQKLFTAAMNHELRAPLNGVLGGIEVIKDADNLREDQEEILKVSYQSAKSMISLVNDLLDYAKLEAGEFVIIKEKFNLKDMAKQVSVLHETLAREKGLNYVVKMPEGDSCNLIGDGTRIQQIITNLLSNAIKYTQDGSVELHIDRKENCLWIEIRDTGEGISQEAMDVLFTPFKRLNEGEHKKIQGTGLGLFVTHMLVTKMAGTIEVESEVGKGSTFTVSIPVEVAEEDSVPDSRDKGEIDLSDHTFLCVDDSAINIKIFQSLLEKKTGAKIESATSGADAIELVKKHNYDIIFLDSMMPNMDGTQTFQRMREMGIATPIVVLTGETGRENEFTQIGFDGYLEKPTTADALTQVIQKLI